MICMYASGLTSSSNAPVFGSSNSRVVHATTVTPATSSEEHSHPMLPGPGMASPDTPAGRVSVTVIGASDFTSPALRTRIWYRSQASPRHPSLGEKGVGFAIDWTLQATVASADAEDDATPAKAIIVASTHSRALGGHHPCTRLGPARAARAVFTLIAATFPSRNSSSFVRARDTAPSHAERSGLAFSWPFCDIASALSTTFARALALLQAPTDFRSTPQGSVPGALQRYLRRERTRSRAALATSATTGLLDTLRQNIPAEAPPAQTPQLSSRRRDPRTHSCPPGPAAVVTQRTHRHQKHSLGMTPLRRCPFLRAEIGSRW